MAIQAQLYQETSGFPMFITNPPLWSGSNGYHESWSNQQMQQFHLQNQIARHTQFVNLHETPSFSSSRNNEIDQFILAQSARLRDVLREQSKREVTELMKRIETRTCFLLLQKDEEIAKAKADTSQLESLLVKLQADCLTWQQQAKQNEDHVIRLNSTMQILQQQCEPVVEDTESRCDEQEQQSGNIGKMVCRACCTREVGVVVLPCRHLCLCSGCDPMVDLCPVCQTVKSGSIEALLH